MIASFVLRFFYKKWFIRILREVIFPYKYKMKKHNKEKYLKFIQLLNIKQLIIIALIFDKRTMLKI